MHISLIGMSNSGKSYWAKKLEEEGFIRLCCDDYIEEKLGSELKKLGYQGIADVSKWLGQPYEKSHIMHSKIYLGFEIESLQTFLNQLEHQLVNKNVIIDTTGSVIYTGKKLLLHLKKNTRIVYFNTPDSIKEEMFKSYIKNPKPVLWGKSFYKRARESDMDALKRCYPELLAFRVKRYEDLADVTINYFQVRKINFDVDNFIKHIEK